MRLKLKNDDKIKIRFIGSLFVFLFSFVFLYCLPLTVHAETVSTLPFSYGLGSGYGYNNSIDFSERQIALGIENLVESISTENYTPKTVLFFEKDLTNLTLTVAVCDFEVAYWGRVTKQGVVSSSYTDCYIRNVSNGSATPSFRLYKISSDGSFVFLNNQSVNTAGFPHQGEGFISSDTDYFMYPLWTYNNYDISMFYNSNFSQYEFLGLTYAGSSFEPDPDISSGSGKIIGSVTDYDGMPFDVDLDIQIDLNPLEVLGEAIRDGVQTLIGKVEEGFQIVIGAIGDTFQMLKNNTDTIVSKIQELAEDAKKPTSQQLEEALDDSTVVGGVVDIAQGGKTFLDSLTASGVQVPSAEDMDFDYAFSWKEYKPKLHSFRTHTSTVHISFSWYESIRSKVLLVLGVFMTIGFTVYLIKQIPNLIAGVSGGGSAGVSISDFNRNNSKGAKK